MIRTLCFALLAVHLAVGAKEDPAEVFRSCAYIPVLPSRDPAPLVDIKIDTGADPASPDARFSVSVTARFDGYVYLFQDPPDPITLILPDAGAPDVQLKKGVTWTQRFRFTSLQSTTLLVAVTPAPLSHPGRLTAAQVRDFFRTRARCGTYYLQEQKF
jgi:hypothetical protein